MTRRQPQQVDEQVLLVERRGAEPGEQRVVVQQHLVELPDSVSGSARSHTRIARRATLSS